MSAPAEQSDRHAFQFSPDVEINFEVAGTGALPLLLLHGFGASLEGWRDIQPHLARTFRLYLVDLKGSGLSSKPDDGAYSLKDQAEIVVSFIEHLHLDRFTLIGHSYGGAVALLAYLWLKDRRCAESVRSLVLIDAAAYLQKLPFFISFLRIPLLSRILVDIMPTRWQVRTSLRRAFCEPSKVTPERIERYARFLDLPGARNALLETARLVVPRDSADIMGRIPEITVPTLILWGENDPFIPVASAHRLRRDIAASRLEIIRECGHIPHEEKPSETAGRILDFLT